MIIRGQVRRQKNLQGVANEKIDRKKSSLSLTLLHQYHVWKFRRAPAPHCRRLCLWDCSSL